MTRNWYQAEVLVTPRHWIKVFFLCVVKGTEAALPADVSHSFTNASNRNFERCRVDSNMWHRITTHGTRNKCWSKLRGKLKNMERDLFLWTYKNHSWCFDNFQTMVISSRNFLPPETKCRIFEFLVNKPYSTWILMKRFFSRRTCPFQHQEIQNSNMLDPPCLKQAGIALGSQPKLSLS